LFLFAFSGCLEFTTKVTLNKDGSGTVEETLLFGQDMIDMFKQLASMGSTDQQKPFTVFNIDDLKNRAVKYGKEVSFVTAEKLLVNGKEGYRVVYSFKDINNLVIDQNPDSRMPMKSMGAPETEGNANEATRFLFKKGSAADLTVFLEPAKKDTMPEDLQSETANDTSDISFDDQAYEIIKGIRFSLSLSVNGEITETDATNREGSTVTFFDLDFGKVPEMTEKFKELVKLKNASRETVITALKNIPGMKVEMKEKVNVKFK
jgi:hypothetical protein